VRLLAKSFVENGYGNEEGALRRHRPLWLAMYWIDVIFDKRAASRGAEQVARKR